MIKARYYIQSWWRLVRLFRECRVWVRHEGVRVAARAMFELNRYARQRGRGTESDLIYALKNPFIELLYKQGYCTSVTLHKQTLKCRECGGTGSDDWGDGMACERCDGTGIYREHILYVFTFVVDGTRYCWHQPERLVTFPIALTDATVNDYATRELDDWRMLTREQAELFAMTVYAYLREHGIAVDEMEHLSLLDALALDLRSTWLSSALSYRIPNAIKLFIEEKRTQLTCLVRGHIADSVDDVSDDGRIYCTRCARYVEHATIEPIEIAPTQIETDIPF